MTPKKPKRKEPILKSCPFCKSNSSLENIARDKILEIVKAVADEWVSKDYRHQFIEEIEELLK